jgi:hypothetical protein
LDRAVPPTPAVRNYAVGDYTLAPLLAGFFIMWGSITAPEECGSQTVRVEHVHVNDGGQAVIGNVRSGTAGEEFS